MSSTEKQHSFPENEYRKAVIGLAEVGKLVQSLTDPKLAELRMFVLHYIHLSGMILRDIKHLADLEMNPHKISTEVTPRERTEKPKLEIPTIQRDT